MALTITGVSGAAINDDNNTNTSLYVLLSPTTTGTLTTTKTSSTKLSYNPSTGTISSTNFNSLSDIRLKTDVAVIQNAMNTISQLDGVSFKWKDTGSLSYGVIAQEIERVLPCLVEGSDPKTVNYIGIIGILINAVKELDTRLSQLETK